MVGIVLFSRDILVIINSKLNYMPINYYFTTYIYIYTVFFSSNWRWLTYYTSLRPGMVPLNMHPPVVDELSRRLGESVQDWLCLKGFIVRH